MDERPGVRGLFRCDMAGDDALLRLARLRFAQAGMPAELYAGSPEELEHALQFVPDHPTQPTVHLDRALNLLDAADREVVARFAASFEGRVAGFVVHDQVGMRERTPELLAALRTLGDRSAGPAVYLEYAAGAPLDWFASLAAGVAVVERAGVCIDTGHVGLQAVWRELERPPAVTGSLSVHGGRLAAVADRVDRATSLALPALLELVADVGGTGCGVHFHLHDGHPALPGLSDHRSFLFRLPVPFEHHGAWSMAPMYGPAGLVAVLGAAVREVRAERLSLTVEVHQAEGRLPIIDDARDLFRHWSDLTNAERFNYWLSVIADNHVLAQAALSTPATAPRRTDPTRRQ